MNGSNLSARHAAGLFAWLFLCALFVFWRTLSLSYALDDINQLSALAAMRGGRMSFGQWLFLPHNEHVVPLLRLLFWGATLVGGTDATAARLAVILVHAAGATACALLTWCVTRDRITAWLAGTLYAGAAGFAGSVVWEIAASLFSISAMFLTAAIAVIAAPFSHRREALYGSIALIVCSCAGMPGAVAAATAIPAYVWLSRPKLATGPWRAISLYLLVQALILLAIVAVLAHWNVSPTMAPRMSGLLGGAWLVYTAPFRFLATWTDAVEPRVAQAAMWSAAAWAAIAISARWIEGPVRRLLFALWAGDAALALLVGLGRSDFTYLTFLYTDRYYYFFLLPLAIQTAAVGASLARRTGMLAAFAMAALIAAGFFGSRLKMEAAVPWATYRLHHEAWTRGKALAGLIEARALGPLSRDLTLADGLAPFDGVHTGGLELSTLFFTQYPHGFPRVRWAAPKQRLTDADAVLENQILDAWSLGIGLPSPVCVVDGVVQSAGPPSSVDFRTGSFENAAVSGFHGWERAFRWMSRSGVIRLRATGGDVLFVRAHAPLNLLRKKWPDLRAFRASVRVGSDALGEIAITKTDEQEFRLTLPKPIAAGEIVRVTLTAQLVWRGVEVDLPDERELSLALIAIGFPPPEGAPAQSGGSCVSTGL